MAGKYRVAFIGCGRIAKLHADIYKSDPRCSVVALTDIKRESAEGFAASHGFTGAIYTDHNQMLAAEKPDIVSICLWTHLHLPVVRDCIQAGIPAVHCEKPMAAVWGEVLDITEAARGSRTQLTFNHQRRFLPIFQKAREIVSGGTLGALERMDCGVHMHLLDMGTHYIDLLNMFNGDSPAQWVLGQTDGRQITRWFNVPCEYVSVTHARYANGVRATIHSGPDNGYKEGTGFRLYCERGMVEIPGWYTQLVVRSYDGAGYQVAYSKEQEAAASAILHRGVMGDIIAGLESGAAPQLGVERAFNAAQVIFATYESSRRRARIDLPLNARDAGFVGMLERGESGPAAA